MCCENPIDLGCVNSCEDAITTVALTGTSTYTVRFMFNGVEIVRTFNATGVGGFLPIPTDIFNESSIVVFALYDSQGDYINCFTFTIAPKITVDEDTDAFTYLDSEIVYVSEQCVGDTTTVVLQILLSDYTLLRDGCNIYFEISDPTIRFALSAGSSLTPSGDTTYMTIPDASLITSSNMTFKLLVPNAACALNVDVSIRVRNYSAMEANVFVGTNDELNFTTA